MRKISVSFLLLGVLLFAGCRASMHVPMHQDVPAKLPSTDVVIGLNQEEIYAETRQSRISEGTGGGLIFALIDMFIDSSRSKKAETFIAPVRNAMNDYAFGVELQNSMQEGIGKIDWMHVRSIKQEQPFNNDVREKILQSSSSSAVLIMKPRYYLTPDLAAFKISMEASIYPVSPDLKTLAGQLYPNSDAPLLYRNQLTFASPLRGDFDDKDKAAQAWCADSGKLIRSAVTDGIAEISRMLVLDLETARNKARGKNQQQAETAKEMMYDGNYGTVVAETPGRVVLRVATGALYSAPKDIVQ